MKIFNIVAIAALVVTGSAMAAEEDAAKPKVDATKTEADAIKPKVDAIKPKVDAIKPKVDAIKPKVDAIKPKVDAIKPKVDAIKPEVDATKPKADATKPEADAIKPKADAIKPEMDATKPKADATKTEEPLALVGMPVHTSGKVVKMCAIQLVGVESPHVLVKIETEKGATDIVDLGTAADLKSNKIEVCVGTQLWVSGRIGRINDRELIVAEALSESKFISITRTTSLNEESERYAATRGAGQDGAPAADGKASTVDANMAVRVVDGTVISTQKLHLEGEPEAHTMAKLQTELGIVIVDLGLASEIPEVDLSVGQPVAVTGFVGHCNDKPIIVADMVGNLSIIKRQLDAKVVPAVNENPIEENPVDENPVDENPVDENPVEEE